VRVADRWFTRTGHDDGITQLVEPYVHPIIRCNVWHVRGRERDMVVDTGVGVTSLAAELATMLDRPVVCVVTHAHYDHVGCLHEFDQRLMHPLAAIRMDPYQVQMPLRWSAFEPAAVEAARTAGYVVAGDEMLTALPRPGFDIDAFHTVGADATGLVDEGDVVDLGDRAFEVLHLPGHTPCSIGLWEHATGTLFSGDAVYDGPLIDFLPESDVVRYGATMRRLRDTPASVVHAGHDASFGRDRLVELADAYLRRRG
jgi:glyoxylase-like metal-dependent hydrolase (beta-lactamase superfamily II)